MFNHEPSGYVCPFCRNIHQGRSDHPLAVVYRDDDVIVKVNPRWYPNNPGAVLVVPIEHHENVFDLPERFAVPMQRAVRSVAIAMKAAYRCDGVSTRQHNEPGGNQDVWHHHVHVLPRWHDDGLYGASALGADPDEMQRRARQLRDAWPIVEPPATHGSTLVYLYGPPAVGKLTVAQAVVDRTGFAMFHNHLTVNALAPTFGFGTKAFGDVLHRIRLDVFETAARELTNLVFTNNSAWGGPHPRDRFEAFAAEAARRVRSAGGSVLFVRLTATRTTLEERVGSSSRQTLNKVIDPTVLRNLLAAHDETSLNGDDLVIDTDRYTPDEAADLIVAALGTG